MIKNSKRIENLNDSVTLKLNSLAVKLASEGKKIFNLTAGQLPFRPSEDFLQLLDDEKKFLSSFQYSPAAGFPELRKKIIEDFLLSRDLEEGIDNFDCMISNGAKHSLTNILASIINPGDEAIILAPYWLSYPEIIKLWGGSPVVVSTTMEHHFLPIVDEIEARISKKTKLNILSLKKIFCPIQVLKSMIPEGQINGITNPKRVCRCTGLPHL